MMRVSAFSCGVVPSLIGLIALGLGGGCVRSIQPVLKDEQLITDAHFAGDWVSSDGKQTAHIVQADEHKGYAVRYSDQDGKPGDFAVKLGKVGDITIGQCTVEKLDPQIGDMTKIHLLPVYSFAVIEQTDPHLVFKVLDDKWFGKYIDAHPDEVPTIHMGTGDDEQLLFSGSTDQVQAFILKHVKDDGAFGDDVVFVRPGDPSTQPAAGPATKP
jgi:hypothetical protein